MHCSISAIVKLPLDKPLRQWYLLSNFCWSAIIFTEISLYGISSVRIQQIHLSIKKLQKVLLTEKVL